MCIKAGGVGCGYAGTIGRLPHGELSLKKKIRFEAIEKEGVREGAKKPKSS